MKAVSERVSRFIHQLEPGQDFNQAIEQLIKNELVRRLNRYQFTDRMMQRKYGMTFADFKAQHVVEQRNYAFEVESDFWDWEMALDGIETVESMLAELR